MNQILVTEKLYITPEIKKKKKFYKFEFFISLVVVCVLSSYYIYAEYDKNKDEAVSRDILAQANIIGEDQTTKTVDKLVVMLDNDVNTISEDDTSEIIMDEETKSVFEKEYTTSDGQVYTPIATIRIPKIDVYYPILSETTEELLKKAPTKFWDCDPNEVGNFCIAGHNYRNKKFFSKVPTLENGDIIEITDTKGRTIKYTVYSKYEVAEDDMSPVSQLTNGRKDITLITCTNDSKDRVIVKATEVL